MDPELTEVFCREYTKHMNRLRNAHLASEAGMHRELAKIERETDRLIQAICDGLPGHKVKDRMSKLEARRIEIEARLTNAGTPPPLLHPNMASYYREQVSKLRDALDHPDNRTEAADILRTLIDRIELKPVKIDGRKTLAIDLHGHLAGILSLANKAKGGIGEDVAEECTAMVADLLPRNKRKMRRCWAVTQQQRPFWLERSAVLGPFQNKPALPVSPSDILDRVSAWRSAGRQVGTKGWSWAVEQRDRSIRPRRHVLPDIQDRTLSAAPARCRRP